ncbi:MAG TPA: aminoglycoside phosphotransferase family protein [Acidimicrobiia bacterium]
MVETYKREFFGPQLQWCREVLGGLVTMERQMTEATSATMLVVRAHLTSGPRTLVLRIHTNDEWLAREPDLATREANVLELLEPTAVPAPALVALDADGGAAGKPCVLMERLPGRPLLAPSDEVSYVGALAALAHTIHEVAAPSLRPFARYHDTDGLPCPSWFGDAGLWARALAAVATHTPEWSDNHLVHRDFHPLNVLFKPGGAATVTGVVDWVEARHGPIEADIAHCRMNLASLFGVATADAFLAACDLDHDYNPVWDLVSATDFFEPHESSHSVRAFRAAGAKVTDEQCNERHRAFVSQALAQLGT